MPFFHFRQWLYLQKKETDEMPPQFKIVKSFQEFNDMLQNATSGLSLTF